MSVVDLTAERALQYARRLLFLSDQAAAEGYLLRSNSLLRSADAALRIADHQDHLIAASRSALPARPLPPEEERRRHLQRVYFRTQQADYFQRAAQLPDLKGFPKWARDFYQLAMQAADKKQWQIADENAKCAEAVVDVLESAAQAASESH